MSPLEKDALTCLRYGLYSPLEAMAQDLVEELGFARRSHPERTVETAETYHAALLAMREKGWLKLVRTPRAVRRERWRSAGWLTPPQEDFPDQGDLDFTHRGWQLYRRLERLPDRLVWLDEDEQTFNCVAPTQKACREWFAQRCTPSAGWLLSYHTTRPAQPTRIDEPVRVGKWFSREQQRHQAGWKLTLHYRTLRRRRVQVLELGLDAWLEPREHVHISGSVPAGPIAFWLHVSQNPEGHYLYRPVVVLDHGSVELIWSSTSTLPAPVTPDQAIAYLIEGLQALLPQTTCLSENGSTAPRYRCPGR